MTREIERKYIVIDAAQVDEALKNKEVNFLKVIEINQSYLGLKDKEELRVRMATSRDKHRFFLTYKVGSGLVREEVEVEISSAMYYELTDGITNKTLTKKRKQLSYGDLVISLDFYDAELGNLIIAEVEFEDEKQADEFIPPSWFVKEVTNDSEYKNSSLWLKLNNKL